MPESAASRPRRTKWGGSRILLASYAFPPLQVPMSQVAAKLAAGLSKQGCQVDVITAGPFDVRFGFDPSLLPYVHRNTASIRYVFPSAWASIKARARSYFDEEPASMHMSFLHKKMSRAIEGLLNNNYAAVLTLSPFHSINPVMAALKKRYPNVRWIAHFSDPWSSNPLESVKKYEARDRRHEVETIRMADHLVFTSDPARDLMLTDLPVFVRTKTSVIDHSWDPDLYPLRRPRSNGRFIIRHIGTLFGKRTPEYLFEAALLLLQQRPELAGTFAFDLVGKVLGEMETKAAQALPPGMILRSEPVSYLQSLYLMAMADALVLIEPDVTFNYFVPSKLIDYVGANRPILALTPPGASRQVIERLQLDFCAREISGKSPQLSAGSWIKLHNHRRSKQARRPGQACEMMSSPRVI